MADIVTKDVRSRMMSGIRGKDTKPELVLRKGLHAMGFRFRLHDKKLPGKPDMVFPKRRAVIMAHGCFWHGHDCHLFRLPSTRTEFWEDKISKNRQRDIASAQALKDLGWRVGTVWECALKGKGAVARGDLFDRCAEWLKSEEPELEVRGGTLE